MRQTCQRYQLVPTVPPNRHTHTQQGTHDIRMVMNNRDNVEIEYPNQMFTLNQRNAYLGDEAIRCCMTRWTSA
jgi:hypothetical protein